MQFISRCLNCKHFIHDKKYTCKAFLKGIPDKIVYNKIKHDHRLTGQTGEYIFEEKK